MIGILYSGVPIKKFNNNYSFFTFSVFDILAANLI